ncbi:hypothetical protein D5282_18010 [bacterium 1xD8-48]|nr:hypothetical protein [bacterium 1xD8-48]
MLLKYGDMIQTRKWLGVFVIVCSFACLFKEFAIFFVQQIVFSSKKTYDWMKKNDIGRREIT